MKLKFLRNVLVYGEHREQGTIHEVKDSDAQLLIADRAAEKVTEPKPEKAKPENAAFKPQGKESASRK